MLPALRGGTSTAARGIASRYRNRFQSDPPWYRVRLLSSAGLSTIRRVQGNIRGSASGLTQRDRIVEPRFSARVAEKIQTPPEEFIIAVEQFLLKLTESPRDCSEVGTGIFHLEDGSLQSRLQVALAQQVGEAKVQVTSGHGSNLNSSHTTSTSLMDTTYGAADIATWAALLSQHDPTEIVSLLREATIVLQESSAKPIPFFVFQALTARSFLESSVVGAIIGYLSSATLDTSRSVLDPSSTNIRQCVGHPSLYLASSDRLIMFLGLFSNLIFHARQTWPASRAAITQLFSEYLAQMYSEQSSSSLAGANAICSAFGFCANAMLYFVAWPSTAEPFKNLADQETSQATILKFMATGCTPLELNNFGYRAIAMTQLMQSKTPEEEIWAKLKTLSWPPWKEDKTGMDASIGPEYGVSRAAQTLDQARAAGYGNHAWEQVARLHAGWDTDLTPTVQLRYLVRPFNPSQEEANIWSARIRSTRTLREAWAGFLAYQDSGSSLHPPVYSTMLEKILRDITRQHSIGGREDTSDSALVRKDPNTAASEQHRDTLPGDSLEVSAPPPSAHLETYTRTEPPSVAQFLDLMLTNSVQFGDSTLGYLLSIVPDWESGKLLLSSRPELSDIVNERHWLSARMSGAKLSPKIAKALVAFLLRFPSQGQLSDTGLLDGIKVGEWTLHGRAVSLAVQLLRSGATDTTLGKHLLLALAHSRGFTPVDTGLSKAHLEDLGLVLIPDDIAGGGALHYKALIDRIVALDIALEVEDYRRQHHVPISPVELRAWFTVAGNAGSAAQTLIRKLDAAQASDSTEDTLSPTADRTLRSLATLCLDKICTVIRPHFFSTLEVTDLTSTPSTTQPTHSLLPRLYLVPNHHVLHAFVRALAVANDYPGLLQLTRFMSVYWPELHARLIQDRKGVHIFQRALISLRAALLLGHEGFERRERQPDFYALLKRRGKDGAAPREVQEEIRGVVLGMARDQEEWVWPSVEMVVGYLEHGSRQLERGRKGKRGRRG